MEKTYPKNRETRMKQIGRIFSKSVNMDGNMLLSQVRCWNFVTFQYDILNLILRVLAHCEVQR